MTIARSPISRARKPASIAQRVARAEYAAASAQLAGDPNYAPAITTMIRLSFSDDCPRIARQAAQVLRVYYNVAIIRDEAA